MDSRLDRIELTGLTGLVRLAAISDGLSGDPEKIEPEKAETGVFRVGFVWFPVALVIGLGAWVLLSGYSSKTAEGEPASAATAITAEPAQSPATNITLDGSILNPPARPEEVTAAGEMAPVNGLKISSQ